MNQWINIPDKKSDSDFLKLFKSKEFLQLAGTGSEKIIKLSGIIFITLLTLSYAIGSLEQLRTRMDNPYTNWVDLPLSSTGQNGYDSLSTIFKYFDQKANKEQFLLNDVKGYVSATVILVPPGDYSKRYPHKSRTIEPGEKLLDAILDPKNKLGKTLDPKTVFDETPCGIIIKQHTLESLGIDDWQNIEKIPMLFYDDLIYVDVVAVVKDLPDYCDLVCTPRFYNLLLNGSIRSHDTGVINQDTTNIMTIASPEKDKKKIEKLAKDIFSSNGFNLLNIKQEGVKISASVEQYRYELIFNHQEIPNPETKKKFFDATKNIVAPSVIWSCIPNGFDDLDKPYALAFNFADLGRIREFKAFMGTHFKMNVNLTQVESKDNFKKVTQITLVVSSTLFIFGMLSIVLFISNLLSTHLENMRPNLGTLKAFGLKDVWLKDTYNIIIAYFLIISFVLALIPLVILISFTHLWWMESPFNLFNFPILSAIALIFGISLFFARKTTGKIIQSSPGDLIYGR